MGDTNQEKILEHLNKNLSCKICNGVLICARAVECGHIFCSYCLDLLQSMTQQCPECSHSIKSSVLVPQIDNQVSNLFKSCSPELQRNYQEARKSRNEKSRDRTQTIQNLKNHLPRKKGNGTSARNMDEMCTSIVTNIVKITTPSAHNGFPVSNSTSGLPTVSTGNKTPRNKVVVNNKSKPKSKTGIQRNDIVHMLTNCSKGAVSLDEGIDPSKVECLFQLYDVFLRGEIGMGAGGDSANEISENSTPFLAYTSPVNQPIIKKEDSEEIKALKQKHKLDIDILLKEVEEASDLDHFVQKWTEEITREFVEEDETFTENDKPNNNYSDEGLEFHQLENCSPSHPKVLDDSAHNELWKTSKHLIREYRESILMNKPSQSFKPTYEEMYIDCDNLDGLTTPRDITKIKTQYDLELDKLKLDEVHVPLLPPLSVSTNSGNKSSRSARQYKSGLINKSKYK